MTRPPAPPFDPGVVADVLRQLDKTLRARQLYPVTNPTYLRAHEQLTALFRQLWTKASVVRLHVSETALTWCDAPVLEEPDKGGGSLPFTLFKDGVREITLLAGFETEELDWLLDLLPRARRATEFDDDLLTLLWEREFAFLSYRYVDSARDPGVPFDLAATPGRWPVSGGQGSGGGRAAVEAFRTGMRDAGGSGGSGGGTGGGTGGGRGGGTGGGRGDGAGAGVGAGGQGAGRGGSGGDGGGNAESALERLLSEESTRERVARSATSLTPAELAQLRADVAVEYELDLRAEVIAVLAEIFERRADAPARREVAAHFDTMLQFVLAGRQFAAAARLLREVGNLRGRVPDIAPDVDEMLGELPSRLSDPGAFSELVTAMEQMESAESIGALGALFAQLGPQSLEMVLAALGAANSDLVRALLETTADRLSEWQPDELARLILSRDAATARAAAQRCGARKLAVAVSPLARLLGAPEKESRAVAVHALVSIGSPAAVKALERTLSDTERELRLLAMRALTETPQPTLLPRVTQLVNAPEMRRMEHRERRTLFELYASVAGERGVAALDGLLNSKVGIFGRREDTDVRACAAMGLGRIGSPESLAALKRSANDKDPVVKRGVEIALDGRSA